MTDFARWCRMTNQQSLILKIIANSMARDHTKLWAVYGRLDTIADQYAVATGILTKRQ